MWYLAVMIAKTPFYSGFINLAESILYLPLTANTWITAYLLSSLWSMWEYNAGDQLIRIYVLAAAFIGMPSTHSWMLQLFVGYQALSIKAFPLTRSTPSSIILSRPQNWLTSELASTFVDIHSCYSCSDKSQKEINGNTVEKNPSCLLKNEPSLGIPYFPYLIVCWNIESMRLNYRNFLMLNRWVLTCAKSLPTKIGQIFKQHEIKKMSPTYWHHLTLI